MLLLLLMLGLSSVLAYQALDAARSEARSAERALRGYAGLARWELSRRADEALAEKLAAAASAGAARWRTRRPWSAAALAAVLRRPCARELALVRLPAGGARRRSHRSRRAARGPSRRRGCRRGCGGAVTGLAARAWRAARRRDTVRVSQRGAAGARQLIVYHVRAAEAGGCGRTGSWSTRAARAVPVLREVLRGPAAAAGHAARRLTNENAIAVVVADAAGEVLFRSPAAGAPGARRAPGWTPRWAPWARRRCRRGAVVEGMGGAAGGADGARLRAPGPGGGAA